MAIGGTWRYGANMPATPEVQDRYRRIADGWGERLRQVPAHRWSCATPCTEWTVRDLAAHVVRTHRQIAANVGGPAVELDPPGDVIEQWDAARSEVESALHDERAGTVVGGMFGEQSFESLVSRLLCADTLLHTWDLARAAGLDEHLDDEGCVRALETLGPLDDAIRRPGGFAAKLDPPPDADVQTRLLCFCGRDPR